MLALETLRWGNKAYLEADEYESDGYSYSYEINGETVSAEVYGNAAYDVLGVRGDSVVDMFVNPGSVYEVLAELEAGLAR